MLSNEINNNIRNFDFIGVDDGLSQNSARCMYQDNTGFIWIGTADGLNRYDGNDIVVYRRIEKDPTSIADNYINTIFPDNRGGFWVGSDGGLSYYNHLTDNFINFNKVINFKVSKGAIIDDSNILILGMENWGKKLYHFNTLSQELNEIIIPQNNGQIKQIKIRTDNRNRIWIISAVGIYQLDKNNATLNEINLNIPDKQEVVDLNCTPSGSIIVATQHNLYLLDNHFKILEKLHSSPINIMRHLITSDKQSNIWITYDSEQGIASFNIKTKEYIWYFADKYNTKFLRNIISGIIDASGLLWLGTDGGGIVRFNQFGSKFDLINFKLNDNSYLSSRFIKGMLVDGGNKLWITTTYGGIFKYSVMENVWTEYDGNRKGKQSIITKNAASLFRDSRGTIWHGGGSVIDTFDQNKNRFVKAFDESGTFAIFEDFDKNIWTGSDNKLLMRHNLISGKSQSVFDLSLYPKSIRAKKVFAIAQTDDKLIWFGTDDGLYRIDTKSGHTTNFKYSQNDKHSLSHNYIISILKDSRGQLWIGTRDGLNLYNVKNNNFDRFTQNNGLPNTFIYGILEDNNSNLWISNNRGLSKMTYENTNSYRFRNYSVSDGLQSNEFNTNSYCKSNDGRLFFGGVGGINCFHPDSIVDNKHMPNIVITKIYLSDVEYKTAINTSFLNDLELPYFKNTISFEFSALEYTNPKSNNYAYTLVGVDSGWVMAGNIRFARYANLKPGKYVFKVKATNNDNLWNELGAHIEITIRPPFWATYKFRILASLVLIILVIIAFRFRTHKIRQRNTFLEKSIYERTEELEQQNTRLIAQTDEINKINQSLEQSVEQRTTELQQVNDKLQTLLDDVMNSKSESLKAIIKTQEDERERFAKDLHDGAGQYLAFLKFNLNQLLLKLVDSSDEIKNVLKEQIDLIDHVVQELRQFAYSLMPPVLERIGLNEAIDELVDIYKSSTNIRFDFYTQELVKPLPKYSKIQLYRIIQEVINNAIKHSHCTKISIQLLSYPDNILIIIEDNGVGFVIESEFEGMGLKNLHSRLSLINGKIDMDSQINHGTTITIEVPN